MGKQCSSYAVAMFMQYFSKPLEKIGFAISQKSNRNLKISNIIFR